jgi:hypothetical protein
MTSLIGQTWLTPRLATGVLLLAGELLVGAGIFMYGFRVFLHAPFGGRPGYYQWERGLIIGGYLTLALGLAALSGLLRLAGDAMLSDLGLIAYGMGAVFVTLCEVAWLTAAGLPERLIGALLRIYVALSFVGQAALGAALLETGLLPAWVGWTTVIWNLSWMALVLRARDPYYPFMHLELPLLAGLGFLLQW